MTTLAKFIVLRRGASVPASPRPLFVLRKDTWDDFGHKVQFHLSYHSANSRETRLGPLKILQRTSGDGEALEVAKSTDLPDQFSELSDSFVSLGQEDGYYRKLYELIGDHAPSFLEALRDVAWLPALAADFEPSPAFRNAMVRENGAHRARRFGPAWATGQAITEKFKFKYSGPIEGAESDVDVELDFDSNDPIPGRIVAIIGRNAVGKTRFLASLGTDLAQITRSSAEALSAREGRFPDGRPLFTRIIAISYSAFDRFKRPPLNRSSSYVYCGIRNDKGGLSRASLINNYKTNQKRIRERGEKRRWASYMQTILGDASDQLSESLEAEIDGVSTEDVALSLLSSGQSILAHFVTALLAWIQPNSLVLFDEPETHLHPNAVANLFLILSDVLEQFDSYSIVATHSPLVIQEVPANRVRVFRRVNNVTTAETLPMESFGESLTELTRHVFETDEVQSVYRRTLLELAEDHSPEAIMSRFPLGLSLSAQAYLLGQYGKNMRRR